MADDDFSQFEVSGPVRVMSEWVPGERETHDTQYGPDQRHLVSGASAAVSPDLAQGHELHEPFELYQNGRLVGEYSYDDASYYSPGNPTSNSIERYGLPELEGPHSIRWLGKQATSNFGDYEKGSAANDFSQFEVQAPAPKDQNDFKQFESLGSNHPIAKNNGWTVPQAIQNIWDVAKTHLASNALATAKQRVVDNTPDQLVQQQIDNIKASPYLTDEQKQQNIASIQAGQQKELEDAKSNIPRIQSEIAQTEQSLKKNNSGPIAQVVGGVLPYLTSGVMGPLGPIQAAQQASAETYGDVIDSSAKRLKELHPDWNDGKVVTQAVKAASEASAGSGEAMLALSVVDVPAAGGIISRIAQKIGIGAATMEVANSFAEVQKNMAIKKDVDPKEDWLGQLRNIEFHVQNIATGGAFGGLHGLGGEIGRPSHVPIEDRVPIAEVPNTEEITPSEKAKRESAEALAKAYKEFGNQDLEERLPRGYHFETDENGMTWTVAPDGSKVQGKQIPTGEGTEPKAEPEKVVSAASRKGNEVRTGAFHAESMGDWDIDESEQGFVTNKGRFVTREEAHELASGKLGSLYAEHLGAGGEVKEYKDPYEEAKRIVLETHRKLVTQNPNAGIDDVAKELGVDPQEIQGDYDKLVEEGKIGESPASINQPPVTGTDPWLSSIANRYVEPRVEAGEIGEVTPGKGTTPEAVLARGTAMGPEEIAQHVSDLMQDKGNFRDHAAAVRAREAQLSQDSARFSRIAEANPDDPIAQRNAEDAFQHLTDFHNGPVAKLKNQWHAAGEAMQGQIEVDLGSFNGLREQWLRDVGKEPDKNVQSKMRETARKVREAQAAEQNAMKTLSDEIDRQTARRKLPTEEQVRKNILSRMNGDNPCGL